MTGSTKSGLIVLVPRSVTTPTISYCVGVLAAGFATSCLDVVQPAPDGIGAAKQLIHERAIHDDRLRRARAIAVA